LHQTACVGCRGGKPKITADQVANLLQPERFAQIDQNLTIRFKERQPDGLLKDVFIDDRRDPSVRVTISADHGRVVKNDHGSYLLLEDGILQHFEAKNRQPAMIQFISTDFDLSQYSNQSQDIAPGVRERYVWELAAADDDPVYKQFPGPFRAELHDRLLAPIYPLASAALTFAFLGAPGTTRQSRNFAMVSSILVLLGLLISGFACSVMAVKSPIAPLVQYLMLALVAGVSLWMIVRGVVVEPPAALIEALKSSNARLLRLLGRSATAGG
jgi:lipopolysaccharide export system permease protein